MCNENVLDLSEVVQNEINDITILKAQLESNLKYGC